MIDSITISGSNWVSVNFWRTAKGELYFKVEKTSHIITLSKKVTVGNLMDILDEVLDLINLPRYSEQARAVGALLQNL